MSLSKTLKKLASDFKLTESEGGTNTNVPNAADDEASVLNKLDRSVKFDEIDTITFGLETDDGKIVKVYVNAEQAEAFEKALAQKLGEIDDIEEVLNELSKEYEIIDVEWPEDGGAEKDPNAEDDQDGSDSLDQKVYGPKPGKQDVEGQTDTGGIGEAMTYGEELTMSLMESSSSIESRFTTASQLMVYHAILDLGIPEIALARNPYRAAIIKGIKEVADSVQKSASMKIALKTFIRRAVDYDKEAEANKAEEGKDHVKEMQQPKGTGVEFIGDDFRIDHQFKNDQYQYTVAKRDGKNWSLVKHPKGDIFRTQKEASDYAKQLNNEVKEDMKITVTEEKTEWDFTPDKDSLTIACKSLKFTLGPEELEKLAKGVSNRDAVVVKDVEETPPKKIVFSPRGSNVLVKQVGTSDGYMMMSKDVDDMLEKAIPDRTVDHSKEEDVNEDFAMKKDCMVMLNDQEVFSGDKLACEDYMKRHNDTKLKLVKKVKEALNHLGEKEYQTYDSWKRAAKQKNANVWFDGDKDIGQAMIGPKPYKRGETKSIGEWDGEKGSIYK